jgi:hypothetical protein
MLFMNSKHRKIGPYGLGAVLLITAAVMLRLILISKGWPLSNSDEATMGLQALHILTRGELPIFFYGQNYMGTLEAYIGSFFFLLFGPSTFALRLGLVIMYAGFLLALYLLACLLYTKGIALAALFFLCWGSSDTLFEQLTATGGTLETLLFGTLSLLLASWLALSFHPDRSSREQPPEGARRKRLLAYGCLGGIIGLGLWSHMLILPFVCTSLLLLLLFCRRELLTRASLLGVLGFLIGSFPLLLFNIEHFQDNSLLTLWQLHRAYGTPLPAWVTPGTYILGAILITIPTTTSAYPRSVSGTLHQWVPETGAYPLCPVSEPSQWVHQLSLSCIGFQVYWGLGLVIVWALAVFVAIKQLREQRQALCTSESLAEKEHLVRCTGQLMLLTSAGLIVLSYVTSPNAVLFPFTTARYLIGLWVATPAIVASLWPRFSLGKAALIRLATKWTIGKIVASIELCLLCFIGTILILGVANIFRQISQAIFPGPSGCYLMGLLVATPAMVRFLWAKGSRGQSACTHSIVKVFITNMIKICLLCLIVLILIIETFNTFNQILDAQKLNQRQNTLIHGLLRLHTPHIYSDYWTCDRLIFLSNERIICSVLNKDLSTGQNRYEPYAQMVEQDSQSARLRHTIAYVFDTENDGSVGIFQDLTFRRRFGTQYHPIYLAGFVIYLPANETPT